MNALKQVMDKLNAEQVSEAYAMLELNVSQRKNLYNAVKIHSYNALNKIYGDDVTNRIQEVIDRTDRLTGKLFDYVSNSANINQESKKKVVDRFEEFYDLVFVYHDPNPYNMVSSSSDLTFFNIVTHPVQVFERYEIGEIDILIRRVLAKVKELEEILESINS